MSNAFTKNSANMRNGAGIFYGVIKTLATGTAVTIIGKELYWFKCVHGGTTGYITDTLIRVADAAIADKYNPVKSNYQRLVSYTTYFSASDYNRNHNMELSGYKNSIIIPPGASFSFNTNTGNSTKTSNGWRESIILVNSQRVKGVGGGCCQCSSTIYSCVKQLAGIKILERRPHSIPVGYVPISGEAMVNYGTSDFRFRNDNSFSVFLQVTIDHIAGSLTATLYRINPITPPPPPPTKIIVDGKTLTPDVSPMFIDNRIYIEVRSLFEALCFTVTYNESTKLVVMKRGSEQYQLTNGADSKQIVCIKNGISKSVPISYPLKLVSGRIMFSLRFAGELLDYNVGWDDKTRTATLK